MATDRPDPNDFLELAHRMLRELFGELRGADPRSGEEPWAEVTRRPLESSARERHREPTAQEQRENLTFALATRAVEALEDVALNLAAIRQRLERMGGEAPGVQETEERAPDAEGR
ncbi:hypothetical protein ACI8AF_04430 [Blastococcus sp. SYSU D00669]